ncbi:unnamed protein product, partial [Allacma fusca]
DLRPSIEKTLIDLRPKLTKKQKEKATPLSDEEIEAVETLIQLLIPLKLATEEICANDVNLLSFEAIYLELVNELRKSRTEFGQSLETSDSDSDSDCESGSSFRKKMTLNKKQLKGSLLTLLERLFPDTKDYPNSDDDVASISDKRRQRQNDEDKNADLPYHERLKIAKERSRLKCSTDQIAQAPEIPKKSLKNILSVELKTFEESGAKAIRGYHLSMAYQYLCTIRPTSVQSERVFSIAG